ncbi:hypothetical protein F2Q68_00003641 [Brassica cretica]|uniref:Uncharacterized protein n=1 Tax=Brassica cretica TaxID=69181 RepID=A0A8S9J6J9_BRACR|nr:hypothetical protein F2Q68_00003641 [Brassica cretica]
MQIWRLVSPCRLEVQICKKGVCGDVRSLSRHVRCSMSPPVQGNSGVPLWRHTKARRCFFFVQAELRHRREGVWLGEVVPLVLGGSCLIINEAKASTRFSSYETAVLKLSDTWRG